MNARLLLTCAVLLGLALSSAQADDIYVPADYGTIQEAIDEAASSGDVIHVAAGTYREQLKIDGKSLDLVGAGIGSAIIEAVDLVDRTTYGITQWNGSAKTIDPCVGVVGPGTVNISGFTVDGRSLGGSDFYGVHYFDADGSVTECRVEDVLHASSPGVQSVVSIIATHSSTGSCDLEFSDNVVPNFQKGGIVVMGPSTTFTMEGNTVTNAPDPYNAGNGMQLSYGASGTTSGNEVSGVAYTGEDWGATGILLFESGDISMSGDVVHECQMGVNFSDWHWVYTNTSPVNIALDGLELYENEWGYAAHLAEDDCDLNLTVTDCCFHDNTVDGLDLWGSDIDPWGGSYYTGWDNGDLIAEITGCAFLNTTGYDGIWCDDESGNANNVDVTVDGTAFSGNNEAAIWNNFTETIVAEHCYWGDPAGPTVIPPPGGARDMRPASPPVSPFEADLPAAGHAHITGSAAGRAGDGVYGPVDYDPYLIGNIVCDPDPEYLTAPPGNVKTVAVKYLGGGGGLLFSYQVKFTWDGGVASTEAAEVTQGNLLSDLGGTFFWAQDSGSNEVTVDCALLGDIDGATGPGTMFTVDFTGEDVGTSPIDITILHVRDKNNQPLSGLYEDDGELVVDISTPTITTVEILNTTLAHTDDYIKDTDGAKVEAYVFDDDPAFGISNITADLSGLNGGTGVNPDTYNSGTGLAEWTSTIGSVTCSPANGTVTVTVNAADDIGNAATPGSDDITSDNIAPTAIVSFDAAPGHNEAGLTWDDPTLTDANFYEVEIQSNAWTGYPTYTGGGPAYPSDQDDGTDVWEGTGTTYTVTYASDGTERDVHYYQAFASDWVLHYGPADAGARDRCTNYWLGDVAEAMGVWGSNPLTPFNGLVNDADIDKLGGTYFVTSPAWPDNQCDVGPTDDTSRLGIPLPDDFVGFEDLMIFAMNYDVVSPRMVPFLPAPQVTNVLALGLEERSGAPEVEVALRLSGNTDEVKGLSAVLSYDPAELEFVSARLSGDMSSPIAPVFFWFEALESSVHVDLAVLGTGVTIGGSGDVVYLTFRALSDEYAIDFESATLRGAANEDLEANLQGFAAKPELPTAFRLVGNFPNPFNPLTKVAYHVPHESELCIRIYDIAGREVRVLVDEVVDPGRYQAVWDGRDDAGETVGSGVYFCVMEAPDYRGSQKMLLLK